MSHLEDRRSPRDGHRGWRREGAARCLSSPHLLLPGDSHLHSPPAAHTRAWSPVDRSSCTPRSHSLTTASDGAARPLTPPSPARDLILLSRPWTSPRGPHLRSLPPASRPRRPGRSHSLARTLTALPLCPSALLLRPALHKHLSRPPQLLRPGGNPTPRMCAAHRACSPASCSLLLPPPPSQHPFQAPRLPPADGSAPGPHGKWGGTDAVGSAPRPHTRMFTV